MTDERCVHQGSAVEYSKNADFDYEYNDELIEKKRMTVTRKGDFDDIRANFKLGKHISMRKNPDLYLGFAAFASYTGWNFNPELQYRKYYREDSDSYSKNLSDGISFSNSQNDFSLFLPASAEFSPATCFIFRAAFIPRIGYSISRDKSPLPDQGVITKARFRASIMK